MRDEVDSDTDAGLNILVGVEQAKGLFFEFKIGVIDLAGLQVRGRMDVPLGQKS